MSQFKLLNFYVGMLIILNSDFMYESSLLFYDLPKKGSRGNFGSILDFPGIPN